MEKCLTTLETEVRSYKASQEQSSIIGIRRRIPEDVYINFAGLSQDNTKAIFQLYVFPLGHIDLGQFLYSAVRHHHLFDSRKGSTSVRSYGSGRYCRCAARDYNSALNSFLPSPRSVAAFMRKRAARVVSYARRSARRSRLACRCGTCRNTVGDCAMLHCGYCSPKRERIYEMKQQGQSDDQIVNTFVEEDGIVTLASPPAQGLGPIVTWIGPGIALLLGFWCLFLVRPPQS